MRVFVTGATGALGTRVLPLLVANDHDVTAVARGKEQEVAAAGATPVTLDLFDPEAVERAVAGHDAVLDLATRIPSANRMALPWAWRDNDRLRTVAASNVAAAAARNRARYVRESIAFLYADGGAEWIDEQHPVEPVSVTRSALDAEAAAVRVTGSGGVGVVLRFGQFYGAGSTHTEELLAAAQRGIVAVLGDAGAYTSQVHLDDASAAVVGALEVPSGVYNVVEDHPVTRSEQVAILEEFLDRRLRTPPAWLTRVGPAEAVGRSLRVSNARFRAASGWAPRFPSPREGWAAVVRESRVLT